MLIHFHDFSQNACNHVVYISRLLRQIQGGEVQVLQHEEDVSWANLGGGWKRQTRKRCVLRVIPDR